MNLKTLFKITAFIVAISAVRGSMSCRRDSRVVLSCNHVPKEIPAEIMEFRFEIDTSDIPSFNSSTFGTESWGRLKILKITEKFYSAIVLKDKCFNGLLSLRELYIHVRNPEIYNNTFLGLSKVVKLDLSGCGKLTMDRFKMSLSGLDILPRLQKLVLSNWNTYKGSFSFDEEFVETLLPRNITFIDLSKSQVSILDGNSIKNLKYLEVFNVSYVIISQWYDDKVTPEDFKHVKVCDVSHATLPFKVLPFLPGRIVGSNATSMLSTLSRLHDYRKIFVIETINVTGIVPYFNSLWVYNVTLIIDVEPQVFTKEIKVQHNNLKRLDLRLVCDKFFISSIETLDISNNGLEFVHSTFLSCFRNLISLDISKNQLFKMVNENEIIFQILIFELKYLKILRISENELQNIPRNFFHGNQAIEVIDLSNNKLKQVNFDLNHLDDLKVLNLKHNDIQVLNSDSIHRLNSISIDTNTSVTTATIYLESNPISCSVCGAKFFLKWILTSDLTNKHSRKLKCIGENGKRYGIDGNTLKVVESICKRKKIIISSSISSAFFLILVFVFVLVIYKRRKKQLKKRKINQVINNLRKGEGQYTFAVFLSYASEDEDFVKENIQHQLNENLQLMTGVERQLVSTGDINFRPGLNLQDEIVRVIEASSVITVVVSNNFMNSKYSCDEVNKANDHGKPIVLMFKEHVEEREMERIPVMKTLFKRNVRILWTVDNGKPVLKTTWENVSRSILDLVVSGNQEEN